MRPTDEQVEAACTVLFSIGFHSMIDHPTVKYAVCCVKNSKRVTVRILVRDKLGGPGERLRYGIPCDSLSKIDLIMFWARDQKTTLLVPSSVFLHLLNTDRHRLSFDHDRIVVHQYFDRYGQQICKPVAGSLEPWGSIEEISMTEFAHAVHLAEVE